MVSDLPPILHRRGFAQVRVDAHDGRALPRHVALHVSDAACEIEGVAEARGPWGSAAARAEQGQIGDEVPAVGACREWQASVH